MVRQAIATGATIEQAKENALRELNVRENEEVSFEIIDIPQKKTFGLFGGSPARVKAYIEITPASLSHEYLQSLLRGIGLEDIQLEMKEEEDTLEFTIQGQELGTLIGRRGETLDALQYLVGLVANRQNPESYLRVFINVGDYREKREKALIGLAKRVSRTALRFKSNQILEPMNPYERRIIHNAVQEIDGVTSWSIGDDSHRRVVIGNKGTDKGWNRNRSGTNKRSPQSSRPVSDRKPPDRFPKADREEAPLYGRIDKE